MRSITQTVSDVFQLSLLVKSIAKVKRRLTRPPGRAASFVFPGSNGVLYYCYPDPQSNFPAQCGLSAQNLCNMANAPSFLSGSVPPGSVPLGGAATNLPQFGIAPDGSVFFLPTLTFPPALAKDSSEAEPLQKTGPDDLIKGSGSEINVLRENSDVDFESFVAPDGSVPPSPLLMASPGGFATPGLLPTPGALSSPGVQPPVAQNSGFPSFLGNLFGWRGNKQATTVSGEETDASTGDGMSKGTTLDASSSNSESKDTSNMLPGAGRGSMSGLGRLTKGTASSEAKKRKSTISQLADAIVAEAGPAGGKGVQPKRRLSGELDVKDECIILQLQINNIYY